MCSSAIAISIALACASVPKPTEQISTAELALRQAESVNANEFAPLNMRVAREKLDEAKALVRKDDKVEDMVHARRLAEEALVEAQLAEQTAGTEAAKKSRDEAQQTIDAMRRGSGLNLN
jgi:hypothetical protein